MKSTSPLYAGAGWSRFHVVLKAGALSARAFTFNERTPPAPGEACTESPVVFSMVPARSVRDSQVATATFFPCAWLFFLLLQLFYLVYLVYPFAAWVPAWLFFLLLQLFYLVYLVYPFATRVPAWLFFLACLLYFSAASFLPVMGKGHLRLSSTHCKASSVSEVNAPGSSRNLELKTWSGPSKSA